MGLKNISGIYSGLRHSWYILIVVFAFVIVGCGGSQEATTEQPKPEETKKEEVKPAAAENKEKPKDEKPIDQALTSFVGSDTEKTVEAPKPAEATPTQLAQYEKQIDDLRTENTGLKQKIVKLEQENRGINTRMSEVEAKYTSEKMRADKSEELAKNTALAPKAVEVHQVPSPSTYDDALKAFKSRKYDAAVRGFKSIVDGGASDDVTLRAKYWLGESYFAKKNYKEALPLFQDVLKSKNSEKKADAQFMIGQTYERLGSKAKAKAAYEKVVKDYPMSNNVKRAKERWAKL